jgi:hypothetical protein
MKTCAICREPKPFEAFPVQRKSKDGRHPYCKVCTSIRHRAAYKARGKRSWMDDKVCVRCRKLLPRTAYRRHPDGKVHSSCTDCEDTVAASEANGLKECNICQQWLERSAFYPSKVHLARTACAGCTRKQMKSYGLTRRDRDLRKTFGISLDQYKQLLKLQNGRCPICLEPFEGGNFSYPVDHAHSGKFRGRIRAIVHTDCNRYVLWTHDNAAQLRAAADIIENPLTEWVVPERTLTTNRWSPK